MGADLHAQITALIAGGSSQKAAAKRLGVSESTVSRVLAEHRGDGGPTPAADAVDAFAASLAVLEPADEARLEALRSLARKLDWSSGASTGSAALAVPALTREFRSLLDELRRSASFDELREALLAGDDD
jgi:transcriptional regulator with XRE-family HTH domain